MLKYTAGHINYGGRVTDDWDRRCIMNILNDFYCPEALGEEYVFSESDVYHQISPETNHTVSVYQLQTICIMLYLLGRVHVHCTLYSITIEFVHYCVLVCVPDP